MGLGLMIMAGLAVQLQDPDIEQRIAEKQAELSTLENELVELWEEFYEDQDFGKLGLNVSLEYAWWSNDLDLENGIGFGTSLNPWSDPWVDPEGKGTISRVSYLPLSFRYWSTRDEITGEDVEVVIYGFVGFRVEVKSPEGAEVTIGVTGGLTRFRSSIPGVDSDSGFSMSADLGVWFPLDSKMRMGFGGAWDGVKTSFRHPRTHTVHNFSGMLSWEMSF